MSGYFAGCPIYYIIHPFKVANSRKGTEMSACIVVLDVYCRIRTVNTNWPPPPNCRDHIVDDHV